MFKIKFFLLTGFLLVFSVACTTAPATLPVLPTRFDPTAVPNHTAVPPATNLPPVPPPTAEPIATVPATPQTTQANPDLVPRDVVWVFIDNAVIAAAPGTPKIILSEDPLTLNAHGIQVAPDGSQIAYTFSGAEGRIQFFTLDTRNGAQQLLNDAPEVTLIGPRFSPDVQQLALTRIDQTGGQRKWELQIRGPRPDEIRVVKQVEVTRPTDHLAPLSPVAWTTNGLFAEQLLWGSDALPHGITRIHLETGAQEIVDETDHIRAEISSDGHRAALVTGILPMGPDVDSKTTLTVRDLQAGQSRIIVQDQRFWISTLRWSPDNHHLLYTKQVGIEGPITSLVVAAADASGDQILPIGEEGVPGLLADAAWRDANTLLLLVADAQNTLHLYEVKLDNFEPGALQEIASFDGGRTPGVPPRILYAPK